MNTSRRVEDLHPYFQPVYAEVEKRCHARGLYVFIMEGARSLAYQRCLYARGRVAPGAPFHVRGKTVTTSLESGKVTARCEDAVYVVPVLKWNQKVTSVTDSWHIQRLAVDLGFRSGPGKADAWNLDLENAKKWGKLAEIYAAIDGVWAEVAPERRWGNDWDRDGVPVGPDPDESFVDMPHWEYHPGRTLEQIRAGNLFPFPKQCPECDNFRPVFVEKRIRVGDRGWTVHVCSDCSERELDIEVKCVGLKG